MRVRRCRAVSVARTLTPTPAPRPVLARPGPRQQRGRSKARAPVPRKPCLLAAVGEGLYSQCCALCANPHCWVAEGGLSAHGAVA
ncbi:hypothetical protein XarzCFBP7410_14525 [Xanthomonas arboricola pv. zantedeschiae]|nr:hypothetical protein XarzCFBP7410_14525 [Xanthomonas arboricola pv. zantedeschiae]PPU14258.1 hypothetical protein XarjCFBP1022_04240 [Xanthomonas arboricola]